jgi:hypothetical protein
MIEEKVMISVLNEKQFAKVVNLSYAKVKQMRQRGLITHSRVGRRILYKYPDHVDLFLKSYQQVAGIEVAVQDSV